MMKIKTQRKMVLTRPDGWSALRVTHREHGTRSAKSLPRYKIICGCCDRNIEIFYDSNGLEINGVNGSIENWREILLPLLAIEFKDGEFTNVSARAKKARKVLGEMRKNNPAYVPLEDRDYNLRRARTDHSGEDPI